MSADEIVVVVGYSPVTVNVWGKEALDGFNVVALNTALQEWVPIAGITVIVADIPTCVISAAPISPVPPQKAVVLSQNVTWPTVSGWPPFVTTAVSVTGVPADTEGAESVRVVSVPGIAYATGAAAVAAIIIMIAAARALHTWCLRFVKKATTCIGGTPPARKFAAKANTAHTPDVGRGEQTIGLQSLKRGFREHVRSSPENHFLAR